jgi:hypothetical protein
MTRPIRQIQKYRHDQTIVVTSTGPVSYVPSADAPELPLKRPFAYYVCTIRAGRILPPGRALVLAGVAFGADRIYRVIQGELVYVVEALPGPQHLVRGDIELVCLGFDNPACDRTVSTTIPSSSRL